MSYFWNVLGVFNIHLFKYFQIMLTNTFLNRLVFITGHTLLDKVRNEDIRNECDIRDILRWSRTRRRAWKNHVNRMPNDRLLKIANERKPHNRWYESWTSASQEAPTWGSNLQRKRQANCLILRWRWRREDYSFQEKRQSFRYSNTKKNVRFWISRLYINHK